MKSTYYAASSLDGYIAKEDGDVSWLDDLGISPEESGYEEFYSTVDALVMGRKTYDKLHEFGSWPYGDKPTWVCTTHSIDIFKGCKLQNGKNPVDAYKEAQDQGVQASLLSRWRQACFFVKEGREKLAWLGKLDSGSLKQKVAASIVAISSIHLFKAFKAAQQIANDKLMWYVIIHMTFVLSALGMAYVDKMNKH